MSPSDLQRLRSALQGYTRDERQELFRILREEFPIHDLETRLGATAEIILEAIARSSDLTLRGVRGVIAEAAFKEHVVIPLLTDGWREDMVGGDSAFDFRLAEPATLTQAAPEVRIQVKMQRQKEQRPMYASEASRRLFPRGTTMWVVETQRTRGGTNAQGHNTRPYRFGEFDILAVALHPSTQDWSRFRYTVGRWLIPDRDDRELIFKYQPVPPVANSDWTDDLREAVAWFHGGQQKEIDREWP